jgi:hypothetical protein
MTFPTDDYTPHGYLDLPGHTRNLTPQGVLRSSGAGFQWHFPAYAASYGGRRETYRAGLRLTLNGLEPALSCTYHSKNLMRFTLQAGEASATAEFHTVGPDVLRAVVRLEVGGTVRVGAHVAYTRTVSANGEWGESGLLGRLEEDLLVLQSFEDGDAFALWASQPWANVGVGAEPLDARTATMPEGGLAHALGRRGDTVTLHGVLGLEVRSGETLEVLLARGRTLPKARASLHVAQADGTAERNRLHREDDAFWARAPRLSGDWPAHWRRGFVYDFETLRMMVKQPVGAYRQIWDAMQIQAPRVVLAEAAMDALLLGYADPETAQSMFVGVLEDADALNIPCSREDGSYNMVGADGTVCGTAPEWGYPFLVAETLYNLHPDNTWLERVYHRLETYLNWWLAERTDREGWLYYACSWESGQDDSPRFGTQPLGGGHPVRHVRPVDLHASVAHGAGVMARLAAILGRDAQVWHDLEQRYTALTDGLWDGARYADFDARADVFTAVTDPMLHAPYALGVAHPARHAAGRKLLEMHPEHPHEWPMLAWTCIEAAKHLGLPEREALMAAAVAERAYTFWDAREARDDKTLPGITAEYWPAHGRCGGEGYGWGAFSVHFVLHNLIGYAPTADGLHLRPNLPPAWRSSGGRYTVHLHHHGVPLEIVLETFSAEQCAVTLNGERVHLAWGDTLERVDADLRMAVRA